MSLYTVEASPDLHEPVMVLSLSGWVDAGGAGTSAANVLREDSEVVASFDADALFDYRANRPVLHIEDGSVQDITWPSLEVRARSVDGIGILILSGTEPDFRWRELAASVAQLAAEFGVRRLVTVGAVPSAVPHTLPVPILTTTSDRALLLDDDEMLEGTLIVPGAAVSILTDAIVASGTPAIGYWAQIPHYVQETYHPAVAALLRKVSRQIGFAFDLTAADEEAAGQLSRLDEIVAGRPEAAAYLERLEQIAGEGIPSADEIGAEVERFLRDQGGEGPFG